jgi:hypothetical protein
MPMAIDLHTHALTRRAALQGLGLTALTFLSGGSMQTAQAGALNKPTRKTHSVNIGQRFAACWDGPDSTHHAGWLRLDSQGTVAVLQALELPTRGHGLALLPDGSLLVAARRPGDWLLHLSPGHPAQWLWQETGRVFSGHVQVSADGRSIYTTEIDTDSGQGLLGVRDVRSLRKRAEFKTFGLDPHAVLGLPAMVSRAKPHALSGMLFVANGGIDTAVETGRVKRHLQQMDASIACLHPVTGELLGQWRVPDVRLSLRHLAWALPDAATGSPNNPALGIALQAEHDDPTTKAGAPLMAVLSWADQPEGTLRLASEQPALAGYGGDIAVVGHGELAQFVVSATRGDCLARYTLDGRFVDSTALTDAGALASGPSAFWAGGRNGVATLPKNTQADSDAPCTVYPWSAGKVDNHWLQIADPARS